MIRFKKSAAGDVPAPPAGYATLFVDAATGLPAAKTDDGNVVPLKGADGAQGADGNDGAGVPADGTPGQVLTKIEGGAAWDDAPAGGAPSGTWMSLLPPDGVARDASIPPGEADPLASAAISNVIFLSGGGA